MVSVQRLDGVVLIGEARFQCVDALASVLDLIRHAADVLRASPLAQAMAERDALVEHEAFAAPAALRLRHLFQIFEDAALEVIDLGKAAREQMGARLLAADAAGAEHRDPAVLRRIEPDLRQNP